MGSFRIFDYSILGFGGLFCIVWAIALYLLSPSKINIAAVYFVGISGFRLVWESFTLSGLAINYSEYYAIPIPFLYLIGPSILLYYERLAGRDKSNLSILHFFPFLFAFTPLYFWYKFDSDAQSNMINNILNGSMDYPNFYYILWVIGPKISILFYSILTSLKRSGEGMAALKALPKEIKIFSIILLIYIWIMILTDIFGYLFGINIIYRMSAWSHSIAAIIVYLYSKLNPSSMLEISSTIKTVRYSQSKLTGLDIQKVILKLNHLMEKEAYFADEDLRLPKMAEAMDMTPHQLSELINVYFNMSFIGFINSHRIKSACDMLLEDKRNILSIAFAVGFNSKSAFNRVFRQLIGTSPGEFRKSPEHYEKTKSILENNLSPKL